MENVRLSVSDFVALTNQTLEYAYPSVAIEGEVAEYKLSQGKWVFFKLKDDEASIDCFMPAWQVRVPIEEGMRVIVQGSPKLTKWGRFSVTVKAIRPSGEGSIRKSFELLKAKLEAEGLFAPERKRTLPTAPEHVAVISSTEAAGYADFMKIVNDRWGGLKLEVAHVQVQGETAPDQIIKALNYFNERETLPEVIVIIRGGGSADDLAAFNDEQLVRAIASSRAPTLVGVGHEVDVTLADYAADVRAATPSNAAQLLVPDKEEVLRGVRNQVTGLLPVMQRAIEQTQREISERLSGALQMMGRQIETVSQLLTARQQVLAQLNPETVLARGYALVRGEQSPGSMIEIETAKVIVRAEVKDVRKK
jgi:exodeoxyribonuclease VII large subunit